MTTKNNGKSFLYKKIADKISGQISSGILKSGDQLPSVRKLSKDLGISISTVMQTYIHLESLGLVEAKPQSGYYVSLRSGKKLPEPEIANVENEIKSYGSDELVSNVHDLAKIPNLLSLGAGIPCADILPTNKLKKIAGLVSRKSDDGGITYEFPPGLEKLRIEIAKRSLKCGCDFNKDEIIITSGCIEAIGLALKAIGKPGDTLITESPTYYVVLQMIKNLGMNVLEIPTHPKYGIDIDLFSKAVKNHKIAGALLYPTINNPLGSIMPQENREKLYKVLSQNNLPLIEGDVYGELYFGKSHPKSIKSMDDKDLVLYCSSFSKTIAPGYRVGWMCPGKYFEKVKRRKFVDSIATATFPQMVMAEFLRSGGYDKSLKDLRNIYSSRISVLSGFISEYFPEGTKITRPQGGFYLWVELPKSINSIKLQRLALKENISIAPGPLFSVNDDFLNFIRLSCSCPWTPQIELAIKKLGALCKVLQ